VIGVDVSYQEATESVRVEGVRLSHLSIEAGHLYVADFADGDRLLREQFRRVVPWMEAAQRRMRQRMGAQARISTCFLVDDYTPSGLEAGSLPSPDEVISILTGTAEDLGFRIDYLAREAGCASASNAPYATPREQSRLADIVTALVVEEPEALRANGSRPPISETGWLSNGMRSPGPSIAMESPDWHPPEEYGKWRHSVFIDAELWRKEELDATPAGGHTRGYSCALLSAVWHLLRLGLLRDEGRAVALPFRFTDGQEYPELWHHLPSILQLTADAAPFAAYETLSVLPRRHWSTELAAEMTIDHLQLNETVVAQVAERAAHEDTPMILPDRAADRMSHHFFNEVHVPRDI
jgi:hypothetical protein